MKVKRIYSVDVGTFKVGDVIKIKLTNGVKAKAMDKLRKMLAGIGYTASCSIKPEVEEEK